MIIAEPRGGLCNRMRVIGSAVTLAERLERPLQLVWRIDNELGAPLEAIFEPLSGVIAVHTFNMLEGDSETDIGRFLRDYPPDLVIDDALARSLTELGLRDGALASHGTIHMRGWRVLGYAGRPGQHFFPIPALARRVASIKAGFSRTVGVHVRRTDLLVAADLSPTEAFEERMRALLASGEADSFFLATDSPAVAAQLGAAFPGRIIAQPRPNLDRQRPEAIADAVVDLYALAATRRVLGSYMSSFSATAAALSLIPLDVVRREPAAPLAASAAPPGEGPRFSVAIATRRRAAGLDRLLAALRPQVEGRADREILVVNDGSDDAAYRAVAERYADIARYEALPAHAGIPATRNAAAARCRGDYILFIDDDCLPPPWWIDWIDARLRHHPEIDIFAGTTRPEATRRGFAARVQAHFSLLPQPRMEGPRVLFVTANLAIRRTLLASLGGFGFRDAFPGAGEDVELAVRADNAGARICLDQTCQVEHALDRRLITQLRRYWRYGYSNVWMTRYMTAPRSYRDLFWIRRSAHLRNAVRLFRDTRRQAAGFSANPLARIAAAAAATLVWLAYFDGCAHAAGERLKAERISRTPG